jgi:hypothetical protein
MPLETVTAVPPQVGIAFPAAVHATLPAGMEAVEMVALKVTVWP